MYFYGEEGAVFGWWKKSDGFRNSGELVRPSKVSRSISFDQI